MLYNVQVRNMLNNILVDIPFGVNSSNMPYLIKDIQGLGPTKANLATSTSAGLDGVFVQASRRDGRNLVFKLGYRPDFLANNDVQSLRRRAYEYFPPESELVFYFQDDAFETVKINGFVESHEPNIFSRDPEVVISIICEDPDFKSYKESSISGFNNISFDPSYVATANTGFVLEFSVTRPLTSVRLENLINEDIRYASSLQVGDLLKISTARGSKYAHLTRGGVTTSVLEHIEGPLDMHINPFVKSFTVHASGSGKDNPFKLRYTPKFIGI